jgi:selenocysteine-specific elongation factor
LRNFVIGTAGHIDHGKTLLVKALTGIDADRLDEEKKRGITIDIGFAVLKQDDLLVHFVDLPGHEKFIKNMLAGATGIDFFLLVVAADESVMPQTKEHLEILRLLGVGRGVVALNKIDMTDEETAEIAILEIENTLEEKGFSGISIIKVSAKTGDGIGGLRELLLNEAVGSGPREPSRPFRLPVDRVFSIKGFGTVVTGTSTSGRLKLGDTLTFYPSSLKSKVRNIEVFREKREEAFGGERVALNVPEVFTEDMARGEVAARADSMYPAKYFYVSLELPLHFSKNGAEFQMHVSTLEIPVKMAFPAPGDIPGGSAIAQVRLKDDLALWPGDRFILRLPSPMRTIGGGMILLPSLKRARWHTGKTREICRLLSSSDRDDILTALLLDNGERGASRKEILQRLGLDEESAEELGKRMASKGRLRILAAGEWWIESSEFGSLKNRVINFLNKRQAGPPPKSFIKKEELFSHFGRLIPDKWIQALLDDLARDRAVVADKDKIRLASFEVPLSKSDEESVKKISAAMTESFPAPRSREELLDIVGAKGGWILNLMADEGKLLVFDSGGFFIGKDGLHEIIRRLKELSGSGRSSFKVPEFKDFFGLTRKTAIPLLEYLDEIGVTKRAGDERIIIPRGGQNEDC